MKIAILGDLHFGARNSHQVIESWQRRFFEEVFWPKMDELGIEQIVQMGDYFDNRKWINLQTMAFQKEVFVNELQKRNMVCEGIIGNHDIPLRHSLENNSPGQILNHEDGIDFYDTIKEVEYDGRTFTYLPWICKENYHESIERIRQGGDVLIGHLEIANFIMHGNHKSHDGINMTEFKKWNTVLSGHYHTQSIQGNIQYVGTPYQMSWNDATSKHGFWIFDTADSSMEYVDNQNRYFNRFHWDDGCKKSTENLYNSFVKVNVQKKTDFEAFEKFVDKINFESPYELKITESFEEFNAENVEDLISTKSTEDMIEEYIEDVATDNNKEQVKKLMMSIYQEAMSEDDQV